MVDEYFAPKTALIKMNVAEDYSSFVQTLYDNGFILRRPNDYENFTLQEFIEQKKMSKIFRETEKWLDILDIANVGSLNKKIDNGELVNLIMISEALHEKKIAEIADKITSKEDVKLVLIAGPSSSGKTTFANRLGIQLRVNGVIPVPISLDDYFVNRDQTPIDENGEYDFESLYALDLPFFNAQLNALLMGEEVQLTKFDFTIGKRLLTDRKLRIGENTVLIIEGIHALNPELTQHIAPADKYNIYVSALTSIMLDDHNYIPTTDNRLLRRILRDYKYRGYSAEDTISRWPSVRKGEEKWIFPFQENADAMFNSALLFELAILKGYLIPILEQVKENCPAYSEAYRLQKFLQYFESIPDNDLPPTSLLREFLGGSSFKY